MTSLPRPTARTLRRRGPPHRPARPGFPGRARPQGGVRGVLRHLGAVQLDTISVLARSHELIPYARLGAVGRDTSRTAYWTRPAARLRVLVARRLHPSRSRSGPTSRSAAAPTAPAPPWHEMPDGTVDAGPQAARGRRPPDRHGAGRRARTAASGGTGRTTKIAVEWLLDVPARSCAGAPRLEAGLRPRGARRPRRPAPRRPGRRGVPAPPRAPGRSGSRRRHPRRHRRLPPAQGRPGRRGDRGLGSGAGRGRGLAQAGLGGPGGAGDAAARPPPHDAALAVRLAGLGPRAHRADLRLHAPPRGVRPQAEADPRLLRDAAARGRAAASAASTRRARARTLVARQVSLDGAEGGRAHGRRPCGRPRSWVGCDGRAGRASRPPAGAAPADLARAELSRSSA